MRAKPPCSGWLWSGLPCSIPLRSAWCCLRWQDFTWYGIVLICTSLIFLHFLPSFSLRALLSYYVVVELSLSSVWLFVTPLTVAFQAPLPMVFSRQEYWSGLPFPSPGYLPDPGIEPTSSALAGRLFTTEPPAKPLHIMYSNAYFRIYFWGTWPKIAVQIPQVVVQFK